jgi:hypothetical protein
VSGQAAIHQVLPVVRRAQEELVYFLPIVLKLVVMAEIPRDLPKEQHALFRALTAHADAANQKIIGRVDKLETEQKDTRKDANVALAKANAACRGLSEALKRIDAIEKGQNGGQQALPVKLKLEEALRLEIKNVKSLVTDSRTMMGTVVVGYHRSTGIERMEKLQLAEFVAKRTSADHCSIETRGRVGVIHFEQRERRTSEVRARDFVRNIEEGEDSSSVWARIERPEQLRRAEGLARSFAKFVQSSFPTDNQPRARCLDGYLLIDNVVIAPVTMFQTAASFGKLRTVVNEVLYNNNRTGMDLNTPLFKQLRHSIVVTLYEFYDTVNFIFDDKGPLQPQAPPSRAVQEEEHFVDITDEAEMSSAEHAGEPKKSLTPLLHPPRLPPPKTSAIYGDSQQAASNNKFVPSHKRGASSTQGFLKNRCPKLKPFLSSDRHSSRFQVFVPVTGLSRLKNPYF